jgi:UDP-GlcNAc:undecaprenyl-phosphate/decaprenyl-phosphate GlcNAc-1-phosphate transferase
MQLLKFSLCSLLISVVLTIAVRSIARRLGIVAAPRKDRWHTNPTALLGGIAIATSFFAGYLIFGPTLPHIRSILVASLVVFGFGLVDDLFQLKPYTKLVAQLIAASMVVYFGLKLEWTNYAAIDDIITIFWLVGITNALNLLDNMDGLAAGVSLIACASLTITFLLNGQVAAATLPALLGGACLGFLIFNFNPASIFMGDCGSMFLGFTLGAITMLSDIGRTRNLTPVLLTPVLILLLPIFDTCMVTVTRKLSGRAISQGGRDHASHRLVALGVSERRAVLILYALAAASGVLALMLRLLSAQFIWLLVPGFVLMITFVGLYLSRVKVYDEDEQPADNGLIRVLVDFSHKRRIFEVLLDVALIVLAYYGALVFRWDGGIPAEQVAIFVRTVPLMIVIELISFLIGGVYRGLWRYAGLDDLLVVARSVLIGSAGSMLTVLATYGFNGPSRAVLILNGLLLFVLVGGSRVSFRLLRVLIAKPATFKPGATPVLIYGAGDGGELLIRELMNNTDYNYAPVGFIDDDARKAGKLIHGYRIFSSKSVGDVIRDHGITEVLISSLKVPDSQLADLRSLGVSLRRMSIRIE